MSETGRFLVIAGIALIVVGGLVMVAGRVPWLGRLPGDFTWRRGNVTVYVPIMTGILVSILLSLVLWLVRR